MNKEKDIEEMTEAVMCAMEYREKTDTPNFELIAQNLINAGYGNVKQAVKEFLYKIENLLVKQENRYSRLCASKRTLLNLHKKITELYGADE